MNTKFLAFPLVCTETIWAHDTSITGTLPSEIGNLSSNLIELRMPNTNVNGPLPSEIGKLSNLDALRLPNTRISGTIPSEMRNMASLRVLDIQLTDITGTLPADFDRLSNLETLFVGGSSMTGVIGQDGEDDDGICSLPKLQAICTTDNMKNPPNSFLGRGDITCGCSTTTGVCNCGG